MSARSTSKSEAMRMKRCGTRTSYNAFVKSTDIDPNKIAVMNWLNQLASNGAVDWDRLDNGDIQLRFSTGERFLLGRCHITRLE